MPKKKPEPQLFTTVTDMRAVPVDKIDHFCEDLRLWLHMHKHVELVQAEVNALVPGMTLTITTPVSAFGWIDDGRHDANIRVTVEGLTETPPAVAAVDPHVADTGTPPTRV